MSADVAAPGTMRRVAGRSWSGRNRYLAAAICVAIGAVMISPIVLSVLASLKTTAEAAAVPPTYLPSELSLDSYQRLWDYQQGLPVYLANSFLTAFLAILFTLALTIPAGYALARFPIPGKEILFVFLLLALIIPYQALLTPMFLMFAQPEADQLGRRAGHRPHDDPAAVLAVRDAQQLRGRSRASSRRPRSSTAAGRCRSCGGSSCRR